MRKSKALPPQIAGKPSSISRLAKLLKWRLSAARSLALRGLRGVLLDPEAHRVPRTADHTGLLHGLERHQRHIEQGLVANADLQRPHGLAFGERRDQWIGPRHLGLDLGGRAG